MLGDLIMLSVPEQRPADVDDMPARLRPFACPTGIHDSCSSSARHDFVPDLGLAG